MNPVVVVRDLLDRQLGRVTMYRLVTIVLSVIAVVMLAYTAAGTFEDPYTVKAELLTLVVLLIASYGSNRVFGLLWRIKPHGESAVITALLLFFLFPPESDVAGLAWIAVSAVLGNLSKYVLAWRGRHVFNPAAAGAYLVYLIPEIVDPESQDRIFAGWWVASEKLLPFVAIGALLVLWRTRRLDIGLTFIVIAGALGIYAQMQPVEPLTPKSFGDAFTYTVNSTAIVFLAGFMLSEPLTLPPRRAQQLVVAAVTAVVFAYPSLVLTFTISPPDLGVVQVNQALALLVGNLVAFAFARRRGLALELEETRQLSDETHELTFRSRRPVSFTPGQYVELTVPHAGMDGRGARRTFSISSPPEPDGRMSFALRVPPRSSSFKKALLALEPGQVVHGTGVGGDFVWPSDPDVPLLLVAGGIGITPFVSQLKHAPDRDVILVYGAPSPDEVPFADELADVRVVLVCPGRPAALPERWTHVEAPFLSAEIVEAAVPDLAARRAYVSGPPQMVNAVRADLKKRCAGLKTDYFSGY